MAKKDKKAAKASAQEVYHAPVAKAAGKDSFYKRHLYSIIIFVFSFLLFANSIPNDYNLDDELVTNNHHLTSKGISAIPEIFTSPYYNDGHYAYEYRPVVLATFAVEHSLFGDNPHMSHFINVLLYSLCCIILFKTLRKLWPGIHPLFHLAVTLLFVAHPSHTEVVCNIKCRDEILALLFSLLALKVALRFGHEKKWWLLPIIVILYGVALLNKLTIISFVIIIPLTLILFTEASLGTVIILSILLILASLPLINLVSVVEKMMLGIVLLFSIVAAYIFIKPVGLFSFFRRNTPSVSTVHGPQSTGTDTEQEASDTIADTDALFKPGTGFAPLLKGIKPARDIFSFDAAALPFIFLALAFTGLFLHITLLLAIGGAGLFTLILIGNTRFAWWASILFYCIAIAAMIQYPLDVTIYSDLIALGLAYQVFFGRRDLFIPSVILYFAFSGVGIFMSSFRDATGALDNISTLYFLLFFLGLRWKYTWPVSAFIFIGAIHSPINYIFFVKIDEHSNPVFTINTIYYGGAFLVVMTALLFLKRSLMRPLTLIFSACSLIIVIYFQVTLDKNLLTFHTPQGELVGKLSKVTTPDETEKLVHSINPTLVPGKMNRPLRFLEQPVNVNDPVSIKLGTASVILFHYLYKTILPYPMSFYYGYRYIEPTSMNSPMAIAGFVLYAVLLLLSLWLLKKDRIPGYAIIFYLISIVVFSNFIQPVPGLLADRFMLIPSLGWCILFVWLLAKLFKINTTKFTWPSLPSKAKYTFVVLLVLYTGISFARNFDWKDTKTLFLHDIKYVDNSAQAHYLVGGTIMQQSFATKDRGKIEALRKDALSHFQRSLEIYPGYLNAAFDAGRSSFMLGMQLEQDNRQNEADQYFKTAESAFRNTILLDSTYLPAEFELAQVLDQEGRYDEAIPLYRKQISIESTTLQPYLNLSYLYFKQKNYKASIAVNKEALEKIPGAYDPTVNTAKSYTVLGETDSAYVWMERAYAINPKDMDLIGQLYSLSKEKGYTEKADYYGNILGVNNQRK